MKLMLVSSLLPVAPIIDFVGETNLGHGKQSKVPSMKLRDYVLILCER